MILLAFYGENVADLSTAVTHGSKEYFALVHEIFPHEEISVYLPLSPDVYISLVRYFPETGRLHQIRAHLLSAGFPIVGDKLYGRDETFFSHIYQTWSDR
jgi:23S rRNA-/tRNA-specific pseudouridylate synthase